MAAPIRTNCGVSSAQIAFAERALVRIDTQTKMAEYSTMDEYISHNIAQQDATNNAVDEGKKANESEEHGEEKSAITKLTQLPLSRIKHIMKLDPDVNIASQEAVFLITKSTELFLQSFARESITHTIQAKRKTLQRKDLDKAANSTDALSFLVGALDQ